LVGAQLRLQSGASAAGQQLQSPASQSNSGHAKSNEPEPSSHTPSPSQDAGAQAPLQSGTSPLSGAKMQSNRQVTTPFVQAAMMAAVPKVMQATQPTPAVSAHVQPMHHAMEATKTENDAGPMLQPNSERQPE